MSEQEKIMKRNNIMLHNINNSIKDFSDMRELCTYVGEKQMRVFLQQGFFRYTYPGVSFSKRPDVSAFFHVPALKNRKSTAKYK